MENFSHSQGSGLRAWWKQALKNLHTAREEDRLGSAVWNLAEPLHSVRDRREILAPTAKNLEIEFLDDTNEEKRAEFQQKLLSSYAHFPEDPHRLSFNHAHIKKTASGFVLPLSQPGAELEEQFLENRAKLLAHTMGIKIAVRHTGKTDMNSGGRLVTGQANFLSNSSSTRMEIEAHVSDTLYPLEITPREILQDIRDRYEMLRLIVATEITRSSIRKPIDHEHVNIPASDNFQKLNQHERMIFEERLRQNWNNGEHRESHLVHAMLREYDRIFGADYRRLHSVHVYAPALSVLAPKGRKINCAVREI